MISSTIVVPCYNEASRLPVEAYREFLDRQTGVRFLFVNDGSTDSTQNVLQQLSADSSGRCDTLQLPENRGKAEAVRRGVLRALESDTALVGFWDADLATPLEAIPVLAEAFNERPEVLMVFGSRVRLLGRHVERDPFRHYAGRLFATVVSLILEAPVYDTQCGAKLFRACSTVESLFQEEFITEWIFDVEILARLRKTVGPEAWRQPGNLVHESPLRTWHDVSGSKVRPQDFLTAPLDLWAIYRTYLKD